MNYLLSLNKKTVLILSFFFITFVFLGFFFKYFQTTLKNNDFLKNTETIPIIESDKEPFKIKPENEKNKSDPFIDSCTLNNEC